MTIKSSAVTRVLNDPAFIVQMSKFLNEKSLAILEKTSKIFRQNLLNNLKVLVKIKNKLNPHSMTPLSRDILYFKDRRRPVDKENVIGEYYSKIFQELMETSKNEGIDFLENLNQVDRIKINAIFIPFNKSQDGLLTIIFKILPNIKKLYLCSRNNLESDFDIPNNNQLELLNISAMPFLNDQKLGSLLRKMNKLQELILCSIDISGLALRGFSIGNQLQILRLQGLVKINDIQLSKGFERMHQLVELSIFNSKITGSALKAFPKNNRLKVLELSYTYNLQDNLLEKAIAQLPNLNKLVLRGNLLTGRGLTSIHIQGINNLIYIILSEMPNLQGEILQEILNKRSSFADFKVY